MPIIIESVQYVPQLTSKLISESILTAKGYSIIKTNSNCKISKGNITIYLSKCSNNLYTFEHALTLSTSPNWHARLCHINNQSLQKLYLNQVIPIFQQSQSLHCPHCVNAKSRIKPIPNAKKTQPQYPLQIIFSDICGPLPTSIYGHKYFITYIDGYTKACWVHLMLNKSDQFSCFKQFQVCAERQAGTKITQFHSDNGGEYTSNDFKNYLAQQGIKQTFTATSSPFQNGTAERKNRTLIELTKATLFQFNLNENLWNFAILNVNFILNRIIPNDSNLCSIEKLFKLKPFLDHVRIFGSKCNFLIHKSFRKKLELNTKEGILIGFDEYSGNYRILTLDLKVITARDVIVDETTTLLQFTKNFNELSIRNTSRNVQCTNLFSSLPVVNSQPITVPNDTSSILNLRSRNPICYKEARAYNKLNQICIARQEEDDSPSFDNALHGPDKKHWQKAIQEEVDSLQKQHTWTVTDLSINAHTIGSRFVLKAK